MKTLIIFLFVAIGLGTLYGQQTVSTDSIKFFEGKTITVCSKVSSTFMTKGDKKTTFLNFGPEYPNQLFTVVIYQEDLQNFSYVPAEKLERKKVCITGEVKVFDGAVEIAVEKENQIRIVN
ncbi:MAG: hypothetical protein ABJC12_06540 [Saprospiraceae bacterium]